MLRFAGLTSLVVLLLAAPVAAEDKEAAREAYKEGTRQFDIGEYRAALEAFKRAYLNYEEPAFLFNIAQCHRMLGEKQEALRVYRTFLRKLPDAPNRNEIQKIMNNLEAAIANEEAAKARSPQGTIEPPSHVTQPPSTPPPSTPSESKKAKPQAEKPVVVAKEAPAPSAPTPVYKKWWLWTTVALVAVGVGVGVGLGVASSTPVFNPTLPETGPGARP